MIMHPRPGATAGSEFGTMLQIRTVQMLPDGRSIVETWGSYRFRIMERGTLDGYMVGRIERWALRWRRAYVCGANITNLH